MSEYPNIDKMVNFKFFSAQRKNGSLNQTSVYCSHIGYLENDGYNTIKQEKIQRLRCSKCDKRFGNDVNIFHLYTYQEKIQMILYELFFYKYTITGTAKRWGIPQDKLSKFKKKVVNQIYSQNQKILDDTVKSLPMGVMLADETFMGSMGNSNTQIVFINNIFEVLSTGPAAKGNLKSSIIDTFEKIPEICRDKLRILLTDGESSYKSIPQLYSKRIIHVIQYHNKYQLGQISIQKYEKVGPHMFHYIIKTHWKAFSKDKHVLRFRWEIKLIKGSTGTVRGRTPNNKMQQQQQKLQWRQKVNNYLNGTMKIKGSAEVFVNFKSEKISMRVGSTIWMKHMLQPVLKIFKGKCVTTGYVESKHHQIKSMGADRKQIDSQYSHELFAVCCFIVDNGYLPPTNIYGRSLFKYLIIKSKKERFEYVIRVSGKKTIQTTLAVL